MKGNLRAKCAATAPRTVWIACGEVGIVRRFKIRVENWGILYGCGVKVGRTAVVLDECFYVCEMTRDIERRYWYLRY